MEAAKSYWLVVTFPVPAQRQAPCTILAQLRFQILLQRWSAPTFGICQLKGNRRDLATFLTARNGFWKPYKTANTTSWFACARLERVSELWGRRYSALRIRSRTENAVLDVALRAPKSSIAVLRFNATRVSSHCSAGNLGVRRPAGRRRWREATPSGSLRRGTIRS